MNINKAYERFFVVFCPQNDKRGKGGFTSPMEKVLPSNHGGHIRLSITMFVFFTFIHILQVGFDRKYCSAVSRPVLIESKVPF
jgi:hypothetical protein